MIDWDSNSLRENDFCSILYRYIPYKDLGGVSKDDDKYNKIDRIFYRTDINKKVRVQVKVRNRSVLVYKDIALRYYGNRAINEWENTQADEVIEVIIDSDDAWDWENAEILEINRLNINLIKESGYKFSGNYGVPTGKYWFDNNFVSLPIKNTGEGLILTFPESLNKIIPGVFETLYTKV